MNMKKIKANPDFFNSTGLKNFSVPDLYSIILDKHGPYKRRLFIYASDGDMPLVPVHSHKYIDEMTYLFGHVEDICYIETSEPSELMHEYQFSRLNQEYLPLYKTNESKYFKVDKSFLNEDHKIYAHHLHTVKVKGVSAWIITELCMNPLYEKYEGLCYANNPNLNMSTMNVSAMKQIDYDYIMYALNTSGYELEFIK